LADAPVDARFEIDGGSIFPEQFSDHRAGNEVACIRQEEAKQSRRLRLQTNISAVFHKCQRRGMKLEYAEPV
jgi:hypothetical protein